MTTLTAHGVTAWETPVTLRTLGLSVGYHSRQSRRAVLSALHLAVHAGELICLLGPNGVGKSTLLRTLAKMQPPLAGRIELNGRDLAGLTRAEIARCLGVVLTEREVSGVLRARQVVEFGRFPHSGWFGRLDADDDAVVQWALDAAGAGPCAERQYETLSDGERQRVMIARALAQQPTVLLLDEPTAFLDVSSRVDLVGVLRRLARAQQLAIVVSTHDLELALRTADTIWLVTPQGTFHAGAPEDLLATGIIAETFNGQAIEFRPAERTFRLVPDIAGTAVVRGAGLAVSLAVGVLEREGFSMVDGGEVMLTVDAAPEGWTLSRQGHVVYGVSYAALAHHVRQLAMPGETR